MLEKYISAEDINYQLANLKQLTFEITDACNLKCKYCTYGEFYNNYEERNNSTLSLFAAIRLIDYLAKLWNSEENMSANKTVYISFYGGEPLMNISFIKLVVSYIENLDCPNRVFNFSMTTNGILLKQNLEYLVQHNFNLLISLDGDEYNTSYRVNMAGKPAYNAIKKAIDNLRDSYPEYFIKKVNFNAVLHNRNSVSEIYSFFKENYDKIPSIGDLNNSGIKQEKTAEFQKTFRNFKESLFQAENYEDIEKDMFMKSSTYKSVTTFIHQYSGFVFRDYLELLFGKKRKTIPTGTCIPFSRRLFVTVNGKILPCERIGQQFVLGSVTEQALDLDCKLIADKYNSYLSKLSDKCSSCYNFNSCIQCVFNLNILEDQPICYGFMNREQFEKYKESQMNFLRKHPEEYYRIMEEVVVE